jgi:hypothetical protein
MGQVVLVEEETIVVTLNVPDHARVLHQQTVMFVKMSHYYYHLEKMEIKLNVWKNVLHHIMRYLSFFNKFKKIHEFYVFFSTLDEDVSPESNACQVGQLHLKLIPLILVKDFMVKFINKSNSACWTVPLELIIIEIDQNVSHVKLEVVVVEIQDVTKYVRVEQSTQLRMSECYMDAQGLWVILKFIFDLIPKPQILMGEMMDLWHLNLKNILEKLK